VADFAIFLTPVGGMFANGSINAFGLISFVLTEMEVPLLCRVINKGPA
jgi:hypothetical protein